MDSRRQQHTLLSLANTQTADQISHQTHTNIQLTTYKRRIELNGLR